MSEFHYCAIQAIKVRSVLHSFSMNILSLLSELSQVQKNKYLYFPFIQNLDPQSSHEIRSPSMGRAGSLQDGGEGLRESRGVVDMIKVHIHTFCACMKIT